MFAAQLAQVKVFRRLGRSENQLKHQDCIKNIWMTTALKTGEFTMKSC
jgi:hypothetical protein